MPPRTLNAKQCPIRYRRPLGVARLTIRTAEVPINIPKQIEARNGKPPVALFGRSCPVALRLEPVVVFESSHFFEIHRCESYFGGLFAATHFKFGRLMYG